MKAVRVRMRQLVDWHAALWAGLISGVISFTLGIFLSWYLVKSPWFFTRLMASIILGAKVLPPPVTFNLGTFIIALLIFLIIMLIYTAIIATIVHKYGIIISFLGGALVGLAAYAINFYSLSYFFPWFYPYRSWIFLVAHIVFGALAGSLYELMEVEVYVREPEKEQ